MSSHQPPNKHPRSLRTDVVVSAPRRAVCLTSSGLRSSQAVLASPSWIALSSPRFAQPCLSLCVGAERGFCGWWSGIPAGASRQTDGPSRQSAPVLLTTRTPAPLLPHHTSVQLKSNKFSSFCRRLNSARFCVDLFPPTCSLHIACGVHEY